MYSFAISRLMPSQSLSNSFFGKTSLRFYHWAWCYMAWNIPLVNVGQQPMCVLSQPFAHLLSASCVGRVRSQGGLDTVWHTITSLSFTIQKLNLVESLSLSLSGITSALSYYWNDSRRDLINLCLNCMENYALEYEILVGIICIWKQEIFSECSLNHNH